MKKTKHDNMIKAYECVRDLLPDERCKACPYGYGYLDTNGDNAFWWCDTDGIAEDMYNYIKEWR